MRLLVLGGSGQLGTQLRTSGLPRGVELFAPARSVVDLGDAAAIRRLVAAESWSAVINAAGYTNVDRAESEQDLAFAINAEAAASVGSETGKRGIPLIHVSTDYVFDGLKGAPYVESDRTAPLNAYGRSKLAGELGVATANPRHVILRTAWLYSPHGKNFVRTIVRLAHEREQLNVVADQLGCPTAARDVAQACLAIALHCATEPNLNHYGLYHFSGAAAASWFEFANAIVAAATDGLRRTTKILPVRTADYPTAALRPADTRLDSTAVHNAFGVTARPWHTALSETVAYLIARKEIA